MQQESSCNSTENGNLGFGDKIVSMKSFVDLIHSNGDSQDETDSENEEDNDNGHGKSHHRLETIAE